MLRRETQLLRAPPALMLRGSHSPPSAKMLEPCTVTCGRLSFIGYPSQPPGSRPGSRVATLRAAPKVRVRASYTKMSL